MEEVEVEVEVEVEAEAEVVSATADARRVPPDSSGMKPTGFTAHADQYCQLSPPAEKKKAKEKKSAETKSTPSDTPNITHSPWVSDVA